MVILQKVFLSWEQNNLNFFFLVIIQNSLIIAFLYNSIKNSIKTA